MKIAFRILLVLFVTQIVISCGKDDNLSNQDLTPPQWIQGSWSDELSRYDFKFTEDDFILISNNGNVSLKEELLNDQGGVESANESISDFEYKLEIKASISSNYHFKKVGANEIEMLLPNKAILVRK